MIKRIKAPVRDYERADAALHFFGAMLESIKEVADTDHENRFDPKDIETAMINMLNHREQTMWALIHDNIPHMTTTTKLTTFH